MITLLQKLVPEQRDRWIMGGAVVIAANAGGAWTPIGDVTTTMLWIGGEVTSATVIRYLFLPSFVCFIVSFLILSRQLKGPLHYEKLFEIPTKIEPYGEAVFFLGILALISVPIFKAATGLPPFMGILFGLGILWLFYRPYAL